MKIVQSNWSCNQTDLLKFDAGWYAPEYHLMSWTLSCLQLRKYYDDITLFTDSAGAKMFIDTLQLPYTKVICNLDELNHHHPQLFALPKIHTYSLQTEPFLHVDSDVFIWRAFDENLLSAGLIVQNQEAGTQYYEMIMQALENGLNFFPPEIIDERKNNNLIYAYNAGIMGGNDIGFFNLYTKKAKEFINKNVADFSKIPVHNFNIFFEQYLFYCLAKKDKKKVSVLITDVIEDLQYTGFGDFIEVPHNKQYLHLIGVYKRHKKVCSQLADRLRLDYPEYYYRIIALFKDKSGPLKRDYYHFLDKTSELFLTDRYQKLKADPGNNIDALKEVEESIKSERLPYPMAKFITDTIAGFENKPPLSAKKRKYIAHLKDINLFENRLIFILKRKFSAYSNDCLYRRDINYMQYFQLLFENTKSYNATLLIADAVAEQIQSKFNWAEMEQNMNSALQLLATKPSHYTTMVVPECDVQGYSLINIDELDSLLLDILQNPVTIATLLTAAKPAFDPVEIENSPDDFERLIINRIKMLLETKLIKVAC